MINLLKCLSAKLALLFLPLCLAACAGPHAQILPNSTMDPPRLTPNSVVMPDGYVLPLKTWSSADEVAAVVLALHGFNDYSNAFDTTARHFAEHSITTYAIDQRGFGETAQRGLWAGLAVMQSDLVTTAKTLCARHPDKPLFLLGESMGGAVIISAADVLEDTCVQGVILSAPAVWGWQAMPWWQGLLLRLAAHTLPAHTVTGEGLDIRPSDNIEMLRALGSDPLVIKATRFDTIYGLTDLMEAALANSSHLQKPALILYGEHDEIIPPRPTCRMLEQLPDNIASDWRMLFYPDGYHMLTRDLQAEVVLQDIVVWIGDTGSDLPSGLEVGRDSRRLQQLCRRYW